MGLNLYMVGVVVADMQKAVEFYRRLGVEIPEGSEQKPHVEVKMNGVTFFLHSEEVNRMWDREKSAPSGGYRTILEFYFENREKLDQKFQELVDFGYEAHFSPYETPIRTYFGMINDPDGNSILLSAGEVAA